MNSNDVCLHDECPRLQTWSAEYALPAIPLAKALHDSLRAGLIAGRGNVARETLLQIAAEPGLDMQSAQMYDIAVHHAAMMEVITEYLAPEPWIPAGQVDGFEPDSFILPDGRLRRVVLCSAYSELRKREEVNSWRTMADVCVTGRPMLLNFITIGQSKKGFRSSPWVQGYIHPENGLLRTKRIATEKTGPNPKFTENWKKVYREQTDHKPKEWLKIMQHDQAFDGLVQYLTVDVPPNRKEVLADLKRIEREIVSESLEMRRAACFRFAPCVFAGVCHKGLTPENAGFKRETKVGCLI